MPTISVHVIKKPRKIRICEEYRHSVLIPEGDPHVRIYGSAESDDLPYLVYICLECAAKSGDPKIIEALGKNDNIP